MKPVAIHPDAEAELRVGLAYYEGQREGLGAEFRTELEASIERIRLNPKGYGIEVEPDARACPTRRFPYTIYYQEFEDLIWIVAVAHQRRRPG
ncbi:MAG: type II toxin-antitoxin system RelE/ParE family toxin [Gemmataceae bacterium]